MADDITRKCPHDAARVNINEDCELQYWAERFGVTPERVRESVAKVGESAEDVEHEIERAA